MTSIHRIALYLLATLVLLSGVTLVIRGYSLDQGQPTTSHAPLTERWLGYTDERFGYAFRYPADVDLQVFETPVQTRLGYPISQPTIVSLTTQGDSTTTAPFAAFTVYNRTALEPYRQGTAPYPYNPTAESGCEHWTSTQAFIGTLPTTIVEHSGCPQRDPAHIRTAVVREIQPGFDLVYLIYRRNLTNREELAHTILHTLSQAASPP